MTWVHWPVDRWELRPLVPRPLAIDEFDGTVWVSLVALVIDGVRPSFLPERLAVPSFCETNLRTYVVGPTDRPGIWCFSLDAGSALVSIGARALLGAPFHVARLEVAHLGDRIGYRGERRWSRPPASYELIIERGPRAQPGDIDVWLTDRWRAFTAHRGRIVEAPVHHEPWRLRDATLVHLRESLSAAAGVQTRRPDRVHTSDGVGDVAFGAPRLWREPSRRRVTRSTFRPW